MSVLLLIWLLFSTRGSAEPIKGNKYLRAVALDLVGRPPTPEEYAQMGSGTDLPLELINQWLDSEAFLEEAAERHRKQFWNRLNSRTFNSGSFALQYTREESPIFYTSKAERMDGLVSTHPYNCEDYESTLDENG
ncbi:MAG: hypothetical protein VX278_00615, partial [Myxococcota bacterium]|nr:hypothetical protein [Myxococcota bacterium]